MELNQSLSAVITGGASGIGKAVAFALVQCGVKVAIFDVQEALGNQVAKELGAFFVKVDVTSDESVDKGFEQARKKNGQERVLVNCAGILNAYKTAYRNKETGGVEHFPLDKFEKLIQVNLIGTFRCIAKSAAGMLSLDSLANGEKGVIINTGSVAAVEGQMGQVAYSASKAAVVGMTLPIARDLSSEGIRVNTIMPGIFNTPMLAAAPEKVREALASQVPFPKRLGNPSEYASLALEMIRNEYLNGESIRLDGAIRMGIR